MAPLKEAAERRMDMNCMGPEALAERERDRREQEYREAAQRRETALLDQMERDRYACEERERDRERQREREEARRDQDRREQADRERRDQERDHARRGEERHKQQMELEREQARRDQAERDQRAAADRRRNESRPVQSVLSTASTGWRGGLRSSP